MRIKFAIVDDDSIMQNRFAGEPLRMSGIVVCDCAKSVEAADSRTRSRTGQRMSSEIKKLMAMCESKLGKEQHLKPQFASTC